VDVVPSGAGAPTGVVTFREGPTVLGTGPLNAARQATFTTSTLAIGAHPITASYPGSPLIDGSTSDVLTETVIKAASTTALASAANPAVSGQVVVLTATVSVVPPGVAAPTGLVTFLDGVTVLGTRPLNTARQATFTTGTLAIGAHEITASYPGSALIDPSTSVPLTETISKAPTATTLTSTMNPSVLGGSVTFTATVNVPTPGAGTPTGTVTFMDGGTVLGAAPLNGARQATLTTDGLAPGGHSITAGYAGDASFEASTSTTLSQMVVTALTQTTIAVPFCSVFGVGVSFIATVSAVPPGVGTPTGSVTFFDGVAPLGTTILNQDGQASFTTSTLSLGDHPISASYGGDVSFPASISAPSTVTILRLKCPFDG
jgi:hypothetical protein